MQQEASNKNIYSIVRIKHVQYKIKMLKAENQKEVIIKDLYKKTNVDEQSFVFDHVFDQDACNKDIYDYTYKNIMSKAFDNINCCMISLGVNGSGKQFTLFGDDFRRYPKIINLEYKNSWEKQ